MRLSAVAFSAAFQHFFLLSVIHRENQLKKKTTIKKEDKFPNIHKGPA